MDYKSSILREKDTIDIVGVEFIGQVNHHLPVSFLEFSCNTQPTMIDSNKPNTCLHCLDLDSLYADLLMNTTGFLDFNTTASKFCKMMTKNIKEQEVIVTQDEENCSEEEWDYVM